MTNPMLRIYSFIYQKFLLAQGSVLVLVLNSMYRSGLVDTLVTHANMKGLVLTPLFKDRRGFMPPQLKTNKTKSFLLRHIEGFKREQSFAHAFSFHFLEHLWDNFIKNDLSQLVTSFLNFAVIRSFRSASLRSLSLRSPSLRRASLRRVSLRRVSLKTGSEVFEERVLEVRVLKAKVIEDPVRIKQDRTMFTFFYNQFWVLWNLGHAL